MNDKLKENTNPLGEHEQDIMTTEEAEKAYEKWLKECLDKHDERIRTPEELERVILKKVEIAKAYGNTALLERTNGRIIKKTRGELADFLKNNVFTFGDLLTEIDSSSAFGNAGIDNDSSGKKPRSLRLDELDEVQH